MSQQSMDLNLGLLDLQFVVECGFALTVVKLAAEHLKSNSTQPRSEACWDTLCSETLFKWLII